MTATTECVVAAVDVGALKNVGWWRIGPSLAAGGRDLDSLADALAGDLNLGRSVALGIEAPLFIPSPTSTTGLCRQRNGEAGRPWCAGAGTAALAIGTQQTAYLLNRIASLLDMPPRVGIDATDFLAGSLDLLVWEAFVSAGSKDRSADDPHVWDARAAAEEFERRATTGTIHTDIVDADVLNLAAAALLAAGLTTDLSLLSQPCVVVRPPVVVVAPSPSHIPD
ncbi:MAG: hypothetical protein LLG14_24845 [Nocardiaceae bacterium]|nr:hypothetical protein [Nocardiaceae bacterium]